MIFSCNFLYCASAIKKLSNAKCSPLQNKLPRLHYFMNQAQTYYNEALLNFMII